MGSDYRRLWADASDHDFEQHVRDFFYEGAELTAGVVDDIATAIHNDEEPMPRELKPRVRRAIESLLRKKLLARRTVLVRSSPR